MKQFLELLKDVRHNGIFKGDRTGTGTYSVFGRQIRFDLSEGFPIVTTKKIHLKSVIVELLWFLQGNTNIEFLNENGCNIWNEWALTENDLVPTKLELRNFQRFEMYLQKIEKEYGIEKSFEERAKFTTINGGLTTEEGLEIINAAGIPTYHYNSEHKIGDLGPIYGKQWRSWATPTGEVIDQISEVINSLKTKPDSRRIIVSAWNPADLPDESISPQQNVLNGKMALAACHTLFQFYSCLLTAQEKIDWLFQNDEPAYDNLINSDSDFYENEDFEKIEKYFIENNLPQRKLSCQLYQRSADIFLGVPFNIASYALLTHMIAQVTNHAVGDFVHTFGDLHIYSNHLDQVDLQLTRKEKDLPFIKLNPNVKNIFDFKLEDFSFAVEPREIYVDESDPSKGVKQWPEHSLDYDCHPHIKAKVAI